MATGPFPPSIISSLKRYGDHAKASYILYGQWQDKGKQAGEIKGQELQPIASKGSTSDVSHVGELPGLQGYKGVALMWGYPGNVLAYDAVQTPDADSSDKGPKTLQPSLIGYIAERTGTDGDIEIVIAFRGTHCNPDWITNLVGAVMSQDVFGDGNGAVHQGFYKLIHNCPDLAAQRVTPWMAIKSTLQPYVDAYKADPAAHPLPRVITTGHSLGGALAMLAAVDVAAAFPVYRVDNDDYTQRPLQAYTFASPRVGDAKLCTYLTKSLQFTAVQVKNKPDAVPFVPPTGLEAMPGVLDKVFHMLTKDAAAARIDAAAPAANARKPAGCETDPLTAYLVLLNNNLSDRFDTPKAFHDHLAQLREKLEAQKNAATELVEPLLLKPRVTVPGGHAVLSPDQLWRINRDLFDYNEELQKTLKTHWADNPAPKFGTCWIDVDKSGEWGGFDHSLEVYCNSLDSCTNH